MDVPAELPARTQVFSTGRGRRTDATDADPTALVALRAINLRAVGVDGGHVALQWAPPARGGTADRRGELGVRRTESVNRIHESLLVTGPGGQVGGPLLQRG